MGDRTWVSLTSGSSSWLLLRTEEVKLDHVSARGSPCPSHTFLSAGASFALLRYLPPNLHILRYADAPDSTKPQEQDLLTLCTICDQVSEWAY